MNDPWEQIELSIKPKQKAPQNTLHASINTNSFLTLISCEQQILLKATLPTHAAAQIHFLIDELELPQNITITDIWDLAKSIKKCAANWATRPNFKELQDKEINSNCLDQLIRTNGQILQSTEIDPSTTVDKEGKQLPDGPATSPLSSPRVPPTGADDTALLKNFEPT